MAKRRPLAAACSNTTRLCVNNNWTFFWHICFIFEKMQMHHTELSSILRSSNTSPQVYFYLFEVFSAAGIKERQLRYAALGTGLCETMTSVACVSVFQQLRGLRSHPRSQKRHIWTHLVFRAAPVKRDCGALLWLTGVNALALQFMMIEKTGKKVLLLRGYSGMSAVLVLLTITLYFQVSCNKIPHQLMQLSDDSELLKSLVSVGTRLVAALLQHGPGFHLHFQLCQRSRYIRQSRSGS